MPHVAPRPSPAPFRPRGLLALAAAAALLVAVSGTAAAEIIDFGSRELGGIAETTVTVCFYEIATPPIPCAGDGSAFLVEGLEPPFYIAGVFRELTNGDMVLDSLPATFEPGEKLHLVVQWVADHEGPASDLLRLRIDDPYNGLYPLDIGFKGIGTASGVCPFVGALCLGAGGRFKVEGRFLTDTAHAGAATTVQLTQDTGYLWFFSPSNVEAIVKALDGCPVNGHFWVFAGGLTNVRALFTVTDVQAGQVRTYINPQNRPFEPIQDTNAFATCP